MFYESLIPYYSPYEEQEILRQMDAFNYSPTIETSPFYNYSKQKDHSSTLSSSNSRLTKKIMMNKQKSNVDALSFCHTIYITTKTNRTCPTSDESQLFLLPDICCTVPTSKWSNQMRIRWIIFVDRWHCVFC